MSAYVQSLGASFIKYSSLIGKKVYSFCSQALRENPRTWYRFIERPSGLDCVLGQSSQDWMRRKHSWAPLCLLFPIAQVLYGKDCCQHFNSKHIPYKDLPVIYSSDLNELFTIKTLLDCHVEYPWAGKRKKSNMSQMPVGKSTSARSDTHVQLHKGPKHFLALHGTRIAIYEHNWTRMCEAGLSLSLSLSLFS